MAKKTTSSRPRSTGTARKTTTSAKKGSVKTGSAKKHVGDVLGISRARVSKSVPSGGGRPKGIEITRSRRKGPGKARVVGGVRGRGR